MDLLRDVPERPQPKVLSELPKSEGARPRFGATAKADGMRTLAYWKSITRANQEMADKTKRISFPRMPTNDQRAKVWAAIASHEYEYYRKVKNLDILKVDRNLALAAQLEADVSLALAQAASDLAAAYAAASERDWKVASQARNEADSHNTDMLAVWDFLRIELTEKYELSFPFIFASEDE